MTPALVRVYWNRRQRDRIGDAPPTIDRYQNQYRHGAVTESTILFSRGLSQPIILGMKQFAAIFIKSSDCSVHILHGWESRSTAAISSDATNASVSPASGLRLCCVFLVSCAIVCHRLLASDAHSLSNEGSLSNYPACLTKIEILSRAPRHCEQRILNSLLDPGKWSIACCNLKKKSRWRKFHLLLGQRGTDSTALKTLIGSTLLGPAVGCTLCKETYSLPLRCHRQFVILVLYCDNIIYRRSYLQLWHDDSFYFFWLILKSCFPLLARPSVAISITVTGWRWWDWSGSVSISISISRRWRRDGRRDVLKETVARSRAQ